jgi:hypothetical protein
MKKFSEIIDYYYSELHPIVKELDKKREDVKKNIINIFGIIAFIATIVVVLILKNKTDDSTLEVLGFYVFFLLGVYGFVKKFFAKDYIFEFKLKVIKPLIEYMDKNLKYTTKAYIPRHHFEKSSIINAKIDRYSGNDYIKGKIDGVMVEFSDILAQKEAKDSKGNKEYVTLFEGVFFRAEFPKHFTGKTVVLPDSATNLFGDYIGEFLQKNNFGRDKLVKLDNPEFEKFFVVYSNDQIEARYILSHSLMEKMLNFRKKVGVDVAFSFVDGNMYVGVFYNKDSLEPSIFESLLEYKVAKEYIQTLYYALGMVEELKLNQKLWSKR